MDFRIKKEDWWYPESIAHSNYANNDLAYYKGVNSIYSGKFFKYRETQYSYGEEICSDNNLVHHPIDASKIGFTVTDDSWLFDSERYWSGDYVYVSGIAVLNRWWWYPAMNTKWRIVFSIKYRDGVYSSSDWANKTSNTVSVAVVLNVANRFADDSATPQQTITNSFGKITCKTGTDGYPALYLYLQASNGRVPESVHVQSIAQQLWIPNELDGYVDVAGLTDSGYHLMSLDHAPDYLKAYDAFNGKLKINGAVQRYARRGFAPTHTLLHSVSDPGYYFIDISNNKLVLQKVDKYPNPSKIESETVLFDYNSEKANTQDIPLMLNIQAVAGGGGGGGWHYWWAWFQDHWNGGGGGGGGGGFSCMCWIPTLKSGGDKWGLADGSPHVLHISGGGGAYHDSDDSLGGEGGNVWIKFKASDSHQITAYGGKGGDGSNGGAGGTVSVTGQSNDYFWNTQTFNGGAGGSEEGGTGGNVSYNVSGYDIENSSKSGTNKGGYGFPNGGGGGASWMYSAQYMTGGAALHGNGGSGVGGWGAYCESETTKPSSGRPGHNPIVYFYY